MQAHHVFESPDRFVVGTVGEPGQREFYLQARGDGTAVTVAVEKAEVAALAEGLSHLMFEIRRSGGPAPTRPDPSLDVAALEAVGGEVSPDFVLNRLTVAWDGESVVIEAASTEPATGPDDFVGSPVSDEDAADAAAVLAELDRDFDDLDLPEEFSDLDQPVASLRVRLSLGQAASFISRANDVVGAGRRSLLIPCALCGQQVDPAGHACARLN